MDGKRDVGCDAALTQSTGKLFECFISAVKKENGLILELRWMMMSDTIFGANFERGQNEKNNQHRLRVDYYYVVRRLRKTNLPEYTR
jgi:hypothetical protein